ncbi:MAG: diacylglycerol kinase family protein [Clostridiales bacterium]|nr:diacylglycerol kinase family protein [Clostridiales bacterium]
MAKTYVLYNVEAGGGTINVKTEIAVLDVVYRDCVFVNMDDIKNYKVFLEGLEPADSIILCGGDGTLNYFVNAAKGLKLPREVYYYAIGSGNDFARDLGHEAGDDPNYTINRYLEELPTVTANGRKLLFLNGVGYGIDGYCCQEGDRIREENKKNRKKKKINYTGIAIKGLLGRYQQTNAVVTVDGNRYEYEDVWLAPAMHGRYYGGGMMPAPNQQRLGEDKKLTLMVMHRKSKLGTLVLFPTLFKGTHVKHTKYITMLEGKEITVQFDRPTPLQVDGEVLQDVTEYTAKI